MNKVGYFRQQRSGCFWYRIQQKIDGLNMVGIQTEQIELDKDFNPDEFSVFQFYGGYTFSLEKILQYLKNEGKKIVYDMDDPLNLIESTNPNYYRVKQYIGSVDQIIRYADEITASTPIMASYAQSIAPSTKITVLQNTYNPKEWTFTQPESNYIRIGFAGSASHMDDLIEVIPAIKKLQEKYKVAFVIMGFGSPDYQTWFKDVRFSATPEALKVLTELDRLLSTISFEWIPFVDFAIFPQVLTNLALDIGLCPLKDTPFNRCRSSSKALEYLLAGTIPLASNVSPYMDDPLSILVNSGEWYTEIERVILNKEEAKDKYNSSMKWLKENREISTQVDILKSIYTV